MGRIGEMRIEKDKINNQTDSKTHVPKVAQTDTHMDRQTDRKTERQTDRQTDTQSDSQSD